MLTKIILPVVLFAMTAESFAAVRIKCPQVSSEVSEGKTIADYQAFFTANKIVAKTDVSVNFVEQFKNEFIKFPTSLHAELMKAGNKIHIMEGSGVTVDPTWSPTNEKTFDGRPWSEVPGGGGSTARGYRKSPTRIVINHFYSHHGSANLFLHEHGHSLDSINNLHGISNSRVWADLLVAEPGTEKFLSEICGKYCTENIEEGFAELFANFHACPESRTQLETELPKVADFFTRFTTTKNLDRIWEDQSTSVVHETRADRIRRRAEQVRDRAVDIFGRIFPDSE
ncbi:MAG: hypothetical protein V4598_13645 [Bdellovibrionota bacterium]